LFALTTDFNLAKLVKALSLQLGGLISYNSLAEVSGLDYKGVLTHMNILEKTFICKMVPPFFTNKRTELIKAPKIYFFDNGLRNSIIDDFKPANLRQDIGHLNENLIFSQLTYSGIDVKYWRSKSKAEVDFIININSNLFALESKTTPKCATKSLRSFREKYKPHKSVILCSDTIKQDSCVLYLPFVFVSSLSS
jgi:predicted AAA+ superfamily ATPase